MSVETEPADEAPAPLPDDEEAPSPAGDPPGATEATAATAQVMTDAVPEPILPLEEVPLPEPESEAAPGVAALEALVQPEPERQVEAGDSIDEERADQ